MTRRVKCGMELLIHSKTYNGCNYLSMLGLKLIRVNSSPPSAPYMHQWTGSALIQVMACRLFGAKPLPEPLLAYCQLDSWKQISLEFESEFYHFNSEKVHLNLSSAEMAAILSWGRWVEIFAFILVAVLPYSTLSYFWPTFNGVRFYMCFYISAHICIFENTYNYTWWCAYLCIGAFQLDYVIIHCGHFITWYPCNCIYPPEN